MSTVNLYDVLNVSNDCSRQELKDAYRELVKKFHPDKPDGDAEMFELVTHAFNVLSNSSSRSEYDKLFELAKQSDADFFKMKLDSQNFTKAQKSNITKKTKKDNKKEFKKVFEDMDRKHNYKRNSDDTKLSLDDIQSRMKDLELTREQEDIENIHEKIFDRDSFNLAKFNAAFEAMHAGPMDLIPHSGNPDAWNASSLDANYGTVDNYEDLYTDNSTGEFCSINFDTGKRKKLSKKDVEKLQPSEYTKGHNFKEDNYNEMLEKKLKERELATREIDNMSLTDFNTESGCGGYGIYEGLGMKNLGTLSWDNDEDDIQKKYQRLLELRNKNIN